ncbi:CE1759 family FMN reductase [Corynebacterium sp. 335C]
MRRIVVVTAGLSSPSSTRQLADMLADATVAAVSSRGEAAEVEVIEVRDLARDLATAFTAGGLSSPALDDARRAVASADGVIAAAPVFKASYSGLFKMFVDALDDEALRGVPVLVAATAGTARHGLVVDHAMRPLFAHFGAVVAPTGVFAATDDFGEAAFTGGDDGRGVAPLHARVDRAAGQFADLLLAQAVGGLGGATADGAGGSRGARPSGAGVEETGVGFEDLLRGHMG